MDEISDLRHDGKDSGRQQPDPSSVPAAAGGRVAVADELARWVCALANGRVPTPQSFREMSTPAPLPGMSPTRRYGSSSHLRLEHWATGEFMDG